METVTHAEEVDSDKLHGGAMPRGHHTHDQAVVGDADKKEADVRVPVVSR